MDTDRYNYNIYFDRNCRSLVKFRFIFIVVARYAHVLLCRCIHYAALMITKVEVHNNRFTALKYQMCLRVL